MSLPRRTFYENINVMRDVAQDPLLTDLAVGSSQHNTRARILRNGLIISSFSLLEAYIEDRLEEKMRDLSGSRISYSAFSEALRSFLTIDAIAGLVTKISFADKVDRLSLAERHIIKTAGFQAVPPSYTGLGFSPRGSNISETDIKNLFSAFGIRDAWGRLSALCGSLGSSRLSLREDFRNFLRARNRAAHDSATNIATSDVETHLVTSLLIGITSDIVITNAIHSFVRKRTLAEAEAAADNVSSLAIRFIDEQAGGSWIERITTNGNTIKRYSSRDAATQEASSRARLLPIVARDRSLVPTELV
jgi:hypothetical protein